MYINDLIRSAIISATTDLDSVIRAFKANLNALNTDYIISGKIFDLDPIRRRAVRNDFLSTESMLDQMEESIRILTKQTTGGALQKEAFRVFHDVLFKITRNYYKKLKADKHMNFIFPSRPPVHEDYLRPLLHSNRIMVEQIILNILNNALKYGYWGTNIEIDCKLPLRSSDHQVLTVTDFGAEMPMGSDPYRLYYRGPNNSDKSIEGSGIGLYIVKTLTELMGLPPPRHSSESVSEFNVPLIDRYLALPQALRNEGLASRIRTAKKQLEAHGWLERIINRRALSRKDDSLTDYEVVDLIQWKTYKVTLEVEL